MAIVLSEFLAQKPEPTPYLIGRGILPIRGKMVLGGAPKANKSFVALNLAMALVRGMPVFDARYKSGAPVMPVTKPCRILYVEQELGEVGLYERLGKLVAEPAGLDFFIKTRDTALRFDTPEGRDVISGEVESTKPDVVIFDPLAKFHLSDENSAQEMSAVMRASDHLIEKFGCAVIIIHHIGKPNAENPRRGGDRLRGSSAVFADIDTLMEVERKSTESVMEPILQLTFELRRGEPLPSLYVKRMRDGRVIYMGEEYMWGSAAEGDGFKSNKRFAKL